MADKTAGNDAIVALTAWMRRRPSTTFVEAQRHLREMGCDWQEAPAILRRALDARILLARMPMGTIGNDTPLIVLDLKRGATSEGDVIDRLGKPTWRNTNPGGITQVIWELAKGPDEDDALRDRAPCGTRRRRHRERDRELAKHHGRSHIPFGPLQGGEHLLLRCRFGDDGALRTHIVEVV